MPYLTSSRKKLINPKLESIVEWVANGESVAAGDLNYIFTKICIAYLSRGINKCYQGANDCIGSLECCKLELYRRWVGPYENDKAKSNGDVYEELTK